jgi:hypothetical protein
MSPVAFDRASAESEPAPALELVAEEPLVPAAVELDELDDPHPTATTAPAHAAIVAKLLRKAMLAGWRGHLTLS